jgi:hypothetical protein
MTKQPDLSLVPGTCFSLVNPMATSSLPTENPADQPAKKPVPKPRSERKAYIPAITPGLRKLFYVVLALLALLGANSGYLLAVTILEAVTGHVYQNYFYQLMFLGHVVLGVLFILPFLFFGIQHMRNSWTRKNKRAVRVGYALFAIAILVLVSGILLVRIAGIDLKHPTARATVYWLHILTPLVAGWLYWLHRLAGPPIKWRVGLGYVAVVGVAVLAMIGLHSQDPRKWNVAGPKEGGKYFEPSLARTATGNFIPAQTLMMDDYCQKCHPDVHARWSESVHRFSSFNNAAYLASVKETRDVSLKRDGNVQASRWCAGCHDPVPFFSGAFDDANYDLLKHPTAHAGITCTACHAITHVNSTRGNGDYTIEEPEHYPFATSDNAVLQWVNNQLVKAKPALHKKTFLKDFHKTEEFCSTCHKVSLPRELNHYKEFLRGQNHYDTYVLSGVSGHGIRSFYYPPEAKTNCAQCHMPTKESSDFGAQFFDNTGKLTVHDHLFPAANTGIAWLRNKPEIIAAHQEFLKDNVRIDLFGVREEGAIDGQLHAPLRPTVPTLEPGKNYLLETVIRTLKLGHPFTQGTVDSNEIWVEVIAKSGDRVLGRSGGLDPAKGNEVDRWAHFVNVFMLDREGNRINRRNPQDIFTPLYNHQIPPGAAASLHYQLAVPGDVTEPITVEVKLQYRKFDAEYMQFVAKNGTVGGEKIRGAGPKSGDGEVYMNELPITTLAVDRVTFPVTGSAAAAKNPDRDIPAWQRWNDYGIGLLLKGKAELRQAEDAFRQVESLKRYDGPLNLARVYLAEGRLDEATDALQRAAVCADPPPPAWTHAWLSGQVNQQQGLLDEAVQNYRKALDERTPEMVQRRFDFSRDYEVRNQLGTAIFDQARQVRSASHKAEKDALLQAAAGEFEKTLAIDSENIAAHYNLSQIYVQLGDAAKAAKHRDLHARYKLDDNAADRAVRLAREKYPAANQAAEALVIYSLHPSQEPAEAASGGE